MREILFKAKVIDAGDRNGTWIQGYLVVGPTRHFIRNWCNITYTWNTEVVDPETVCQYTGLDDKNGEKIFEGDTVVHERIVSFETYDEYGAMEEQKIIRNGRIRLSPCSGVELVGKMSIFDMKENECIINNKKWRGTLRRTKDFAVITGNIHDEAKQ